MACIVGACGTELCSTELCSTELQFRTFVVTFFMYVAGATYYFTELEFRATTLQNKDKPQACLCNKK